MVGKQGFWIVHHAQKQAVNILIPQDLIAIKNGTHFIDESEAVKMFRIHPVYFHVSTRKGLISFQYYENRFAMFEVVASLALVAETGSIRMPPLDKPSESNLLLRDQDLEILKPLYHRLLCEAMQANRASYLKSQNLVTLIP